MESLPTRLEKYKVEKDGYEAKISDLEGEIRHLQSALDATGIADELLVYKAHADNVDLALGDRVLQQLENAVKLS
ncbi:MAG: hypothetical protein OXI43_09025 [Candidatus Poribacteria bacterium]|nr:hypothetical protein [Candidatus Poribacteria bacterium]